MESLTEILRTFILDPISFVLKTQKKKLLFFILFVGIWLVVLFPKSDTKNFLEQKVSSATKGKVNLELEKLSLTPLPLGVKMVSPSITFNGSKPLKASSITVSPKMSSLLAFKLGATVYLKNFLGGDGNISATLLGKNKEKNNKFSSSGSIENLLVQEILKTIGKDLNIPGKLELEYKITGEDSFRKQPTGDFKARALNIKLPNPLPLNAQMGALDLPKDVVWKNSNFFGKLENGKINITEGTLGTKSSEVNGRFKGTIDVSFRKLGSNISVSTGNYNLSVELELSKAFEKEFSTVISQGIPQANKKMTGSGSKYLFRVSGRAPNRGYAPPPRFSSLSTFNVEE